MDDIGNRPKQAGYEARVEKRHRSFPWVTVVALVALGGGAYYGYTHYATGRNGAPPSAQAPAQVVVSLPVERELDTRLGFLGQFSAADQVEIRAQVGGTLTAINFKDGDVVKKGDPLFSIDPIPYQIKLAQANAQLETATARLDLANREYDRAVSLTKSAAGTAQNVDQRKSDQQTAQASVDDAKAQIRDAQFDLDHCSIAAPFTGRIGNHQVSVGSLVSGSRAGATATTLLTTLVSLDPIYLDFDMSESDYLTFSRDRVKSKSPLADRIAIALSDEDGFDRQGTMDFVDNVIKSSSGTLPCPTTTSF